MLHNIPQNLGIYMFMEYFSPFLILGRFIKWYQWQLHLINSHILHVVIKLLSPSWETHVLLGPLTLHCFMNSIRECVQLKMMEYSRVFRRARYKYRIDSRMQTCTVSPPGLLTSTTQNYLSFLYVTPSQDILKHTQDVPWLKGPKQTPRFAEFSATK
jgi:hypothetical protein